VGKRERLWSPIQLGDFIIDFNQQLGTETQWSVAYAMSYLLSQVDQSGLSMMVGSDDLAKVYLNGKEIYRCGEPRYFLPDQDVVTGVELKAGLNVLVFKVVNGSGHWKGSIRFTNRDGSAVRGLKVTLDPDAADSR
jgi:hypothetical protein